MGSETQGACDMDIWEAKKFQRWFVVQTLIVCVIGTTFATLNSPSANSILIRYPCYDTLWNATVFIIICVGLKQFRRISAVLVFSLLTPSCAWKLTEESHACTFGKRKKEHVQKGKWIKFIHKYIRNGWPNCTRKGEFVNRTQLNNTGPFTRSWNSGKVCKSGRNQYLSNRSSF